MSNEELVARIQRGERDKLLELWEQVERFVDMKAGKQVRALKGLGGVETEDLYQSGFIALVAAVDSYEADGGMSFLGWLSFHLKHAFSEAGGYRTNRRFLDPLHRSLSIDISVKGKDDKTVPLAYLMPDDGAVQAFQEVEDRVFVEQLRAVLDAALEELPDNQAETLRRHYYAGQTKTRAAAAMGVSREASRRWERKALLALSQRRDLQQFVEERTPYYMRGDARSGERTTELIVIKREELARGKL